MTSKQLAALVAAGRLLRPLAGCDRRIDNALVLLRDAWLAAHL